MATRGEDWDRNEVEAVVADYLSMLAAELRGDAYNKAEHNRALQALTGRSPGSIERKHQNASAVLRDLELPFIDGYKPLGHGQRLLAEVVAAQLDADRFGVLALAAAIAEAGAPEPVKLETLEGLEVDPPEREHAEPVFREESPRERRPQLKDYVAIDARNRSLGRAGEEFVLGLEQRRLWDAGRHDLAKRIEHVALSRGDGLGFDIGSFELDGNPRLIEVKTTSFGMRTPFYVSRNEVSASEELAPSYRLYRLFDFRKRPRFFALRGALRDSCLLTPDQFIARVG